MIEVNVHPAAQLATSSSSNTTTLYEEARAQRGSAPRSSCSTAATPAPAAATTSCSAAPTPADSPFLRRPDLLRSLIAYWQNHPSLSYLFSGMFIGPTSQAPRVDEARNDALYELEIAFEQLPRARQRRRRRGWSIACFRNLLVDVTGNTHRAEFCIDKLYSPGQRRRGRLGLRRAARLRDAAARAHEPGAAAAAARAGRAVLARARTATRSMRWGTQLHDRFMLPHFVAAGLRRRDRATCSAPAIAFEPEWFAPHFEFRFPLVRRA